MKPSIFIYPIFIAYFIFFSTSFAITQEKEEPWTGKLEDGTKIYDEGLKIIISEHEKWVKTDKRGGQRANLKKANLIGANLQETDLREANLQKANLGLANLQKANLAWAILQKTNLVLANLQATSLVWADLQEANLGKANLHKAYLSEANLQKANLVLANLQETDLREANLQKANLIGANLRKAFLEGANLQEANLGKTNLQEANLSKTNLQEAKLIDANLQNAYLSGANLKGAIFEIKPNNLPDVLSIAEAKNLSLIKYRKSPHAIVELRTAFKKYGLRKQEREITHAIKRSGYENALEKGNLLTKIEVILGWLFFEKTCKWGMAPERPIFILFGLIFFFTIPYTQAISQDIYGKEKTDGIWKVWIPDRRRKDLGKDRPEELLDSINPSFCFKIGFYFSILSAFNIGWRELNVGNWITRIQPYEYKFYASGWARSVSGIQSIISVYLLALSVLTYFGRPFESY